MPRTGHPAFTECPARVFVMDGMCLWPGILYPICIGVVFIPGKSDCFLPLAVFVETGLDFPFFTQNQTDEFAVVYRAGEPVGVHLWHPETPTRESPHVHRQAVVLPVQYLHHRAALADEDVSLVLRQVSPELSVHHSLQPLELFPHVHRLQAQVVPQVGVQSAYCRHRLTPLSSSNLQALQDPYPTEV